MESYNGLMTKTPSNYLPSQHVIGDDLHDILNEDQTEWEYEEITLTRGPTGLGFTVAGGIDNPHYKNDNSIYITRLVPNGSAAVDGRLKLEDIIVKVDDVELNDVSHAEAVEALKNSLNHVQLLIKRKKLFVDEGGKDSLFETTSIKDLIRKYQKNLPATNINNNNTNRSANYRNSNILSSSNQNIPQPTKKSSSFSTKPQDSILPKELSTKTCKGKVASSSLSLQPQTPLPDNTIQQGQPNLSNSKSTSAVDTDTVRVVSRSTRSIILQRTNKGLGFNIVGGIAGGGTFISYIVPGGSAERSKKLNCGDQILSVNGQDLRYATHEEAATVLKQSGQTVKLLVKYKPEEYIKFENKIHEKNMLETGTVRTTKKKSFYARALFEYDPSKDSSLPNRGLAFKFGDILHITNASDDDWWQARKVLENGQDDNTSGIIPSSKKVEKREKSRTRSVKFTGRNCSESTLDRRKKKISFSRRFPYMKSREFLGDDMTDDYLMSGSHSNSRGFLTGSSSISINNANSDKTSLKNDDDLFLSYEPVLLQKIDYKRPIALYGLKEEVEGLREDLACDGRFPFYKMELIVPYTSRPKREGEVDGVKYHFVSKQKMERDLAEHKFVEAGKLNDNFYGTSIDSIKEVAESGKHCLLNVSPNAIKRLQEARIFPIVIFIKPKSIEFLQEMNKRWSREDAIEAMSYCQRLEQDYGSIFNATIDYSSTDIYNEILRVLEKEQQPRIWIPTTMPH